MISIEVDEEVYAILEERARPFVDTPNTVLRKILMGDEGMRVQQDHPRAPRAATPLTGQKVGTVRDSATFVRQILDSRFGGGFQKYGRYQYMFHRNGCFVYFQNYNKTSDKLWYRVDPVARKLLCENQRDSFLCLTNPAESYAYVIPASEVSEHVKRSGWDKDHLEINIDAVSHRWVDLSWNISRYRERF